MEDQIESRGRKSDRYRKKVFLPFSSFFSYNTEGGTGPKSVNAMIKDMYAQLDAQAATIKADKARVDNAFAATRKVASQAGSIKSKDDLKVLVNQALGSRF